MMRLKWWKRWMWMEKWKGDDWIWFLGWNWERELVVAWGIRELLYRVMVTRGGGRGQNRWDVVIFVDFLVYTPHRDKMFNTNEK